MKKLKKTKSKGFRYNEGKPRICYVPEEAIWAVAKCLTKSAKKYPPYNYRDGLSWTETSDSLDRHMLKWKSGEDIDVESGLPHIWHILTNACFLEYMRIHHVNLDDRHKGNNVQNKRSKKRRFSKIVTK